MNNFFLNSISVGKNLTGFRNLSGLDSGDDGGGAFARRRVYTRRDGARSVSTKTSILLMFLASLLLAPFPAFAQESNDRNVLKEIFPDIGSDNIDPYEKEDKLPFRDGAKLRNVSEPLFGNVQLKPSGNSTGYVNDAARNNYFGKGGKLNAAPTSANGYALQAIGNSPQLPTTAVTVGGKSYSLEILSVLDAYEGDFDGDGRRNEMAFIVGARTKSSSATGHADVLLLCAGDAQYTQALTVVSVLYEGAANTAGNLFRRFDEWIGRAAVVCADVDCNGVDEIISAAPMNKYSTNPGIANDGFAKQTNLMIWSVKAESKGTTGWKTNTNWNEPKEVSATDMDRTMAEKGGHIGSVGTTVSLAAGDIDRDGYEDVVFAVSGLNVEMERASKKGNASRACISISYGNKSINSITANYRPHYTINPNNFGYLTKLIPSKETTSSGLPLQYYPVPAYKGCIGVTIADLADNGSPSILVAYKRVGHDAYETQYACSSSECYSNDFWADYAFVECLDFNKGRTFTSTQIKKIGLSYQYGMKRNNPRQTNAMNIAALKYDYGLSNGKQYVVASGSIVLDGVIYSFVKKLNGEEYEFETNYEERLVPLPEWSFTDDNDESYDLPLDGGYYYNGMFITKGWECIGNYDEKNYDCVTKIRSTTVNGSSDGFVFQVLNSSRTAISTAYYDCAAANGNVKYKSGKIASYSHTVSATEFNSPFVAFPDLDNDGVWLTYQGEHEFFWSDPVIIAALASPPYFEALPSDNYLNSSTTYGKSTATSSGTSASITTSTGWSLSTEVSASIFGIGGKWTTNTEVTNAMTSEAESMSGIEHEISFSAAGGQDKVVLTTAAFDCYKYKIHYPNEQTGVIEVKDFTVLIPRDGTDALKLAQITYDDYEAMRPYSKGALPNLSGVFSHTIGKPQSYTGVGINVATDSRLVSANYSSFPTDNGATTLSMTITKENTSVTGSSTSISSAMGGGADADGEFFDIIGVETDIEYMDKDGMEIEHGAIRSSSEGVSFEGQVYGQNDGFNSSGVGLNRAYFNWRLVRYVYSNRAVAAADPTKKTPLQEFPVITYSVTNVIKPEGVIPTSVKVTEPPVPEVKQMGWYSTIGYESLMGYSVTAAGVQRETLTELIGAPNGITFTASNPNITNSNTLSFGLKVDSYDVPAGTYPLQLRVGGVLSNTFNITVLPEPAKPVIRAFINDWDTLKVLDFGSARFDRIGLVEQPYILIKNISDWDGGMTVKDLGIRTAILQDFEITRGLNQTTLTAQDYTSIRVGPKTNLAPGYYRNTLQVFASDGSEANTGVVLQFRVTGPEPPVGGVKFTSTQEYAYEPGFTLTWTDPDDNGGSPITGYEVIVDNKDTVVVTEKSFSITDAEYDFKRHVFCVRAINAAGISATPEYYIWYYLRNSAAHIFAYQTDGNGQSVFRWYDPYETQIEGKTLAGYEISTDGGETWERDRYFTFNRNPEERDEHIFVYTGLNNGQSYPVSLRQYYTDGTTGIVTEATAKPTSAKTKPVKNLKAEARDGKVILTWDAPDNGQYMYWVNTNNGLLNWHSVGGGRYSSTRTTDEDTNSGSPLVNGRKYLFIVRAAGSIFDNSTDSYVLCTPQEGLPDEPSAPRNITQRLNNDGELRITWDAPDDDGGSEILYYEDAWDVGFDSWFWSSTGGNERVVTNIPVDGKDSEGNSNTPFRTFAIRAVNAVGAGEGSDLKYLTYYKFTGNRTFTLPVGYSATDAGSYTLEQYFMGGEIVPGEDWVPAYYLRDQFEKFNWSLTSTETDKITWDNDERKIKIAEGLAPGTYNAVLEAADLYNGTSGYEYKDFNFTLTVCAPPVITTESLPDGMLNVAYSCVPLSASGGGDIVWTLESGSLPAGLTLTDGGDIIGVAEAMGQTSFTVKATNSAGSATKTLSINISSDITGIIYPDFVIEADATRSTSEYSGNSDIIFKSNDTGTGQLTDAENLQVVGWVKVVKTFAVDKWYPVGFPFEIAGIEIKQGEDIDVEGAIYDKDKGEVNYSEEGILAATDENDNFFVKYYDGENNCFRFTDQIKKDSAYIVLFPHDPFSNGSTVEVTFTSTAYPTLNSGSGTGTFTEDESKYTMAVNPFVANVEHFGSNFIYYQYVLADNHFPKTALASLNPIKPFEALVIYSGSGTPNRVIGQGLDETAIETVHADDPIVAVHYYNLAGLELRVETGNDAIKALRDMPLQPGVYLVQTVHKSGKTTVSKQIKH
jgi:hypothetical protein